MVWRGHTMLPNASCRARWPRRKLAAALEQLGPIEIRYACLATELSVRHLHLDTITVFSGPGGRCSQVEGERWTPHGLNTSATEACPFVPCGFTAMAAGWLSISNQRSIPRSRPVPWVLPFRGARRGHRWVSGKTAGRSGPAPSRSVQLLLDVAASVRPAATDGEAVAAAPITSSFSSAGACYGGLEHDRSRLQFSRQAWQADGYGAAAADCPRYLHQ